MLLMTRKRKLREFESSLSKYPGALEMNSGKINDWLQIGGQFAVLAGLIFVGLQLYQDRQIAKIEVVAEAANNRMYWAELVGQSPEGRANDEWALLVEEQMTKLQTESSGTN
jgi:hypothetical protein